MIGFLFYSQALLLDELIITQLNKVVKLTVLFIRDLFGCWSSCIPPKTALFSWLGDLRKSGESSSSGPKTLDI
jgi:hypothetical protein